MQILRFLKSRVVSLFLSVNQKVIKENQVKQLFYVHAIPEFSVWGGLHLPLKYPTWLP